MSQARVHEAAAVPCARCGAPLAVDPTAPHVWCWTCHVWQAVPEDVRRSAWEKLRVLGAAQAERAWQESHRQWNEARARKERRSGCTTLVVIGGLLLFFVLPLLFSAALYAVGAIAVAFEELEPWAAGMLVVVSGAAGIVLVAALLGVCVWLYRRATRHRRWARMGRAHDWYGRDADGASAPAVVCGECGAPIAFAPGEHAVACGFCRAVVLEPPAHAHALLHVAHSEVQRSRMRTATAERELQKAQLLSRRSALALRTYLMVGSVALLAVPVLAAGYAWRALTPSLEEAMMDLARRLDGDFGAGLGPPFEWLDTYWIGATPPSIGDQAFLASRWSIAGVFHGRPVMVSVLASWSDLGAKRVALLLASPRARDPARVQSSSVARDLRSAGWEVHVDYAGVALLARDRAQRELGVEQLTSLARAAYELSEER